ncbi:MAG: hypothetical protein Q4Q53_06850, partial [Methanocorpusculum sp.]|nr:hypothetical protein [Methanocorpusculum sp.]
VFIAAGLAVFSAGCVSPNTPSHPSEVIDPATALIGEWKSADTYTVSSGEVYLVYTFNKDNTGTAGNELNGEVPKTIEVYWGYNEADKNYAVGYVSSQSVELFTMSSDGKTIYNSNKEKFNKV